MIAYLCRLPFALAGKAIDTALTAHLVQQHANLLAGMWDTPDGREPFGPVSDHVEALRRNLVEQEAEDEVWFPRRYCNGCGGGYVGEHQCLRPPAAPRLGEEVEPSPSAPSSPGLDQSMPPHVEAFVPEEDRIATSELLYQGAVYADLAAALVDGSDQGDQHPYRRNSKTMRRRAEAFKAIEEMRVQP